MKIEVNSSSSVISHIHSLLQDFVRTHLQKEGFPDFASSHGNILFQLSVLPQPGTIPMKELAEKINRDKSTTTVLVRKLESEGFVQIVQDSKDKRIRSVKLTEKGRNFTEKTGLISKSLTETFYKNFTEEEKKQFCGFLERICQNFED